MRAIGRKGKAKGGREYDEEFGLPVFLTAKNLKPFISKELEENSRPVRFIPANGGPVSIGYKAELLPQICYVFIDADDEGVITHMQYHVVERCKILLRGFAEVGIAGLVDEATGYQEVRDRVALQKILDAYLIKNEWEKWTPTFPDEFYKNLFRLKGFPYPTGNTKLKPSFVGHWTNDIIYSRLAPGVLKELKKKNFRVRLPTAPIYTTWLAIMQRRIKLGHYPLAGILNRVAASGYTGRFPGILINVVFIEDSH